MSTSQELFSPTGFTAISLQYKPFSQPPSTSALLDHSGVFLSSETSNNDSTTKPENNLLSDFSRLTLEDLKQLSADARWKLELEGSFIDTPQGELLQLECSISDMDFRLLPPESIGVGFSLYRTTCDLYADDLPETALLVQTNANGRAKVTLSLKFLKSVNCNLQFIAYPLFDQDTAPFLIPESLSIGEVNFNSLFPLASNVISLSMVERVEKALPIIPPGLPRIPLEDTGIEVINDSIGQQETEEIIFADTTLPYKPVDEYSEAGFSNPQTFSPESAVDSSFQLLQGFTKNQSCRYAGWSGEVLLNTHSHLSLSENSEFKVVSNAVLDVRAKLGLQVYSAHLEAAGHHSTVVTSSYAPDPAYGHISVQAMGTAQYNTDHFRIQAGSIFDVHSASSNHVTNQYLLNARWIHLASDTYQAIHKFIWTRAEESHIQVAKDSISYTSDLKQEIAARSIRISGPCINYSDSLWFQSGQLSNRPLHPINSVEAGDVTNQNIAFGEIVFMAMKQFAVVSYQEDVQLQARKSINLLSTHKDICASAYQGSIQLDATKAINLRSSSSVNLLASSIVALDGSQVFINCGRARMKAFEALEKRPIPILRIPKSFNTIKDIIDLPSSEASSPGGKAFAPPSMPIPSSTVGGPTDLGSALYKPPGKSSATIGF